MAKRVKEVIHVNGFLFEYSINRGKLKITKIEHWFKPMPVLGIIHSTVASNYFVGIDRDLTVDKVAVKYMRDMRKRESNRPILNSAAVAGARYEIDERFIPVIDYYLRRELQDLLENMDVVYFVTKKGNKVVALSFADYMNGK